MESKADLLLHPVRLRIIEGLVGRDLTPQQLAEALDDVPQASLYRQINILLKAGMLSVAEERPVRGALEKVYRLNTQAVNVGPQDLSGAGKEDLMRYFTSFLAGLMGDFSRYLKREKIDLQADGVAFRQAPLYLSDQEFRLFATEIAGIILKAMQNEPAPGRTRRLLTTIVIPGEDPEPKK